MNPKVEKDKVKNPREKKGTKVDIWKGKRKTICKSKNVNFPI